MDEQMKWLVELQKADSRILEIDRLRRELPVEIDQISSRIQAEQQRVLETQERFEELKTLRRKKERDLEVASEHIKKSQGRLFEVKTNKEYQALLKEIDQAREANSALEEEILRLMEEMEELSQKIVLMKEELNAITNELTAERQSTQNQLDGLEKESSDWQYKRKKAAEKIDSCWMAHYDKIAKRNNGLAVVTVDGGTCQGCHLNIPPQLYNEILKSGPAAKCPFCLRFIYCESNLEK